MLMTLTVLMSTWMWSKEGQKVDVILAIIGGSAGAHLVTQNIAHVAAYDEMPTDMTDLAGLGLFRGIFICHYTQERYIHSAALRAKNNYLVYTLTDEESLVIEE